MMKKSICKTTTNIRIEKKKRKKNYLKNRFKNASKKFEITSTTEFFLQ